VLSKNNVWVFEHLIANKYDESFKEYIGKPFKKIKSESKVKIFEGSKIITMNPMQPCCNSVAVLDGKILGLGTTNSIINGLKLKGLKYEISSEFRDCFIYPGFIESHSHFSNMAVQYQLYYVGPFHLKDKNGASTGNFKSKKQIVDYLRKAIKEDGLTSLVAWGFDSLLIEDIEKTFSAEELDTINNDIPICIIDTTIHQVYANHKCLEISGYTDSTDIVGVDKDKHGKLTGVLKELKAIEPVFSKLLKINDDFLINGFNIAAQAAVNAGVTTISDLAVGLMPGAWKVLCNLTNDVDFPVRVSNYVMYNIVEELGGPKHFLSIKNEINKSGNLNLNLNGIKLLVDGSLQTLTALMKWPYYYSTLKNGIQNIEFDELYKYLQNYTIHGIQASIHTNGTGAIEVAVNTIKQIMRNFTDIEARFRLEHCQSVSEEQLEEMVRYNIIPNFYPLNLHYWGDFHAETSMGPDLVKLMNPLGSAKRNGLKYAIHTDCPVVPLDPIKSIWAAVNRTSISGEVYGSAERVSVHDALKAVTINAAYILKEEESKGSLEVGKLADMTVLDKNILDMDPALITEARVVSTIKNGHSFKPV